MGLLKALDYIVNAGGSTRRNDGSVWTKNAWDPKQGDVPPNEPHDNRPTANGSMSGCWWATPEHDSRNRK